MSIQTKADNYHSMTSLTVDGRLWVALDGTGVIRFRMFPLSEVAEICDRNSHVDIRLTSGPTAKVCRKTFFDWLERLTVGADAPPCKQS